MTVSTPASRRAGVAVGVAVFLVAALPVALDLARFHGLFGASQYDDGVYFAAAQRLIAGIFPYRDFVLLQPPGIAVILSPFAALGDLIGGRDALGAARVFTAIVVGANAAMVAYLLRRHGTLAMAAGGLALAVFPPGYTADHTFLLEPFCVALCLLGTCLVLGDGAVASPRRCVLGGVLFGAAGAVKAFAVMPLLVVFVIVALVDRKKALRLALGVAGALVVLLGPFFVAAPHAFFHDVIASQLERSTGRPTPLLNRLFALTGLAYASPSLTVGVNFPSVPVGSAPTVAASVGLGAMLAGLGVRAGRRRLADALGLFVVAGGIGAFLIALVPGAYYDHYADFSAPFFALVLGESVGAVRAALRRRVAPRRDGRRLELAGGLVAFVALALAAVGALVPSTAYDETLSDRVPDVGPAIAAAVPAGACVLTDSVNVLVSAGRGGPAGAGCPNIVDPSGTWLAADPSHPPTRNGRAEKDPALVQMWAAALGRAQYFVFSSGLCAFRVPFNAALRAEFNADYVRVPAPGVLVYRRLARPVTPVSAASSPGGSACAPGGGTR